MKRGELSASMARELLAYDPETGLLVWRVRDRAMFATDRAASTWNARFAGLDALNTLGSAGYRYGSIFDRPYKAHRVIWAIQTGEWPRNCVDHINGDKSDNRWANLRAATKSENGRNRGPQANNSSGKKGVYFSRRSGRWVAEIKLHGKRKHLGSFADIDAAAASYSAASEVIHGEFARTCWAVDYARQNLGDVA